MALPGANIYLILHSVSFFETKWVSKCVVPEARAPPMASTLLAPQVCLRYNWFFSRPQNIM